MKSILLFLLFIAFVLPLNAQASDYRTKLESTRERLRALDTEMNDYRKLNPELPPAEAIERLRLLGQLLTDDPVWALERQIQADLEALVAVRSRTAADRAILEDLKDFLAITSSFEGRATTRAQADGFATALRQFIARRDAAGARTWADSQ